jgi:hypothetical protein
MSERNNRGFLTVEALLAGNLDQYAVVRGGKTITVELGAYRAATRPFYVKFSIVHKGIVEESRLQTFISPDKARDRYRELVRSHP